MCDMQMKKDVGCEKEKDCALILPSIDWVWERCGDNWWWCFVWFVWSFFFDFAANEVMHLCFVVLGQVKGACNLMVVLFLFSFFARFWWHRQYLCITWRF